MALADAGGQVRQPGECRLLATSGAEVTATDLSTPGNGLDTVCTGLLHAL